MPRSAALSEFLRSRRDRITPAQAGLDAFPGRRRVPGLRKEEVAYLTGISTDHYSRIEQGRQPRLTRDIVDALVQALRLDAVEATHLRALASVPAAVPSPRSAPAQRCDPGMVRMMTVLDHVPTLLLGRRTEVLARNALLCAVLGSTMAPGTSFARWLYLDPASRERIANWSEFAAAGIGALRLELGRHPDDRRLGDLITELRHHSPDVEKWWSNVGVTDRTSMTKQIAHPLAGPLTFGIESVVGPHVPEQRLVVYTVEPQSQTARLLPILASWVTDDPSSADLEQVDHEDQ